MEFVVFALTYFAGTAISVPAVLQINKTFHSQQENKKDAKVNLILNGVEF